MFTVITGGSGSGKSEYAERLLVAHADSGTPRCYVATMQPYGAEGAARVEKHRRQRAGRMFLTVEQYVDIGAAPIPDRADVLLECMSNLVANEFFDGNGRCAEEVCGAIGKGIVRLREKCRNLVIVTNEVFSDGVRYEQTTREYIRCLGLVNRALYAQAEQVIEVVCSIPIPVKGGLPCSF